MIDALRDLVLAPRCAGCSEPGAWFCAGCRATCEPITRTGPPVVRGAGVHAGPLREAIHRLKYRGEPALAEDLGMLVAREVARDLAAGVLIDAIVPVPLHPSRALARGYDQAGLLATTVAAYVEVALRPALRRIRQGTPQVELDQTARAENVRGSFVTEVRSCHGLRIALVDDVTTTGATITDAAAAARAAGARSVRAYVVAIDE